MKTEKERKGDPEKLEGKLQPGGRFSLMFLFSDLYGAPQPKRTAAVPRSLKLTHAE